MTQHTLFVCSLCRFSEKENKKHGLSGGQHLIQELEKGLEKYEWRDYPSGTLRDRITIEPLSCMAACRRSCAVTLAADDKLTFIFDRLAPIESVPELLEFIEQYVTTPNGKVPYRERSRTIQKSTSFVLPPLSNSD
ncbi:MAG: DUF1636 domain-containing protein [Cyanobacteria bacterium J06642_3]